MRWPGRWQSVAEPLAWASPLRTMPTVMPWPPPAAGDRFGCFAELARSVDPADYRVRARWRGRDAAVAVAAPHGGGIEPGTSELAEAIAATDFAFYAFDGRKPHGNGLLHLTSTRFDEPVGTGLVARAAVAVTVHGCRGRRPEVYVGGLHRRLRRQIAAALTAAGFPVAAPPDGLAGVGAANLTNQAGGGVQLELTRALRQQLFDDRLGEPLGRRQPAASFWRFTQAVRSVLGEPIAARPAGIPPVADHPSSRGASSSRQV